MPCESVRYFGPSAGAVEACRPFNEQPSRIHTGVQDSAILNQNELWRFQFREFIEWISLKIIFQKSKALAHFRHGESTFR